MIKLIFLLSMFPLTIFSNEKFENKKFICSQKENIKEIPLISSKYLSNQNEVYLYKSQLPVNNFNKEWLFFGYEFTNDKKIILYNTNIKSFKQNSEDKTFTYKLKSLLDNFFSESPKQEIVRYPIIKTYTDKGMSKNDIYVHSVSTIINYISAYSDYEMKLRGFEYDFLLKKDLFELISKRRIKFLWNSNTPPGLSRDEPWYNIYIDQFENDTSWQVLTYPKNREMLYKPSLTPNIIFGEVFHIKEEFEYRFDDEKIYLLQDGEDRGEIDRYTLNILLNDNFEFTLCKSANLILSKYNLIKESSKNFFESIQDYENTYFKRFMIEEVDDVKDLNDRKI